LLCIVIFWIKLWDITKYLYRLNLLFNYRDISILCPFYLLYECMSVTIVLNLNFRLSQWITFLIHKIIHAFNFRSIYLLLPLLTLRLNWFSCYFWLSLWSSTFTLCAIHWFLNLRLYSSYWILSFLLIINNRFSICGWALTIQAILPLDWWSLAISIISTLESRTPTEWRIPIIKCTVECATTTQLFLYTQIV
jgi:hypothetical protein